MAGPYGLTIVGFIAKSALESKADFDAAFAGIYGASVLSDTDGGIPAATSLGQEVAILTESESAAWERDGVIYAAFDPDQAITPQLQILCALSGTTQKPATFSSVAVTCYGLSGTALPAGSVITVTTTGTRFVSQSPATLATISATWAALTNYSIGALIINNSSVWVCSTAGESSAGSPPTGTGFQTDGTVIWYRVCASTLGAALVTYKPEVTGPIAAAVLTLVNIATPVAGWQGAVNGALASLGQSLESEPALRARRLLELSSQQGGPPNSIRAAILAIPTVTACIVFYNDLDVAVDTIPPHAVEVLIQAPTEEPTTDLELGLDVFNAVGAGIATSGSTTVTVTDDSGNDHLVSFTRPQDVPIYVVITVFYDASVWTGSNPDDDVEAAATSAIMTYGANVLSIGLDVRSSQVAGAVEDGPYALDATGTPIVAPAGSPTLRGILGVANGAGTDGTLPYIGVAPTPVTSTNVVVTKRQLASIAAGNITVHATAQTP